eukprot:TRINITY_DN7_c3_g1_i1.p1 TRINITY_DN7_c3_g1~~TRINITY_DN7_c3_g1_i1.p1  ORF type:complete len:543 (+),score=155.32 TRINITY_DN7_c3_g1_i1:74-1630(+)
MSLRKFGILCMLRIAGGTRADYDEATLLALANEDQASVSQTILYKLRLLACDDDKIPTEEDNQYCAAFDGNAEACDTNGCHMTDSLAPSGKTQCKAKCKTSVASDATSGLAVPQEVKNAVQKARELAEAAGRGAATKVEAARKAGDAAQQQVAHAHEVAQAAAEKLKQAEAKEKEQQAAKNEMEAKVAEAAKSDGELSARSKVLAEAQVKKQQKLDVMSAKLQAKKEKEAEWKMEDIMYKKEMDQLNSETIPNLNARLQAEKRKAQELFRSLENQIATATARRNELGQKRTQIKKTQRTQGKAITADYMKSFTEYKAEKDKVEKIATETKNAEKLNKQASSSAKSAVALYFVKAEAYKKAREETASAKEESDAAKTAAVEAEFLYAAQSREMAQALQEKADADALKIKVEKVSEYAGVFYDKLKKVETPHGNPMMNVMTLVKDPAMKPCLSSYNVIITAANGITQSNAEEVMSELKTGLTKINSDRFDRFQQWCGTEDFARWIWGANEIEKVELNLAL